ncbi:MAG: hypothetical protein ACPK7O_04610 [Methanobacterium sp.]
MDNNFEINDKKTEHYKTKFLNELKPGEEIEGEIYIGDIKSCKLEKAWVNEFFVVIMDHQKEEKWVCSIITSYYPENGNIYGEREGRVYSLIDSLNHVLNNAPMNKEDNYSVKFDIFRKNINKNVEKVKVKAVQSWKPGAKAVNLEVLNAELLKKKESEDKQIKKLANQNTIVYLAYEQLEKSSKLINKKSIAFELKHFLDNKKITKIEFKDALIELDKL